MSYMGYPVIVKQSFPRKKCELIMTVFLFFGIFIADFNVDITQNINVQWLNNNLIKLY